MAASASAVPTGQRPEPTDHTAEGIRRLLHQIARHVRHHPTVIAAQSLRRRTPPGGLGKDLQFSRKCEAFGGNV
ncbi:hypothetical protein GCM10023079_46720 [Streptomyces chitinivorans]